MARLGAPLVATVLWFWFCSFCALHALVPALPFDGHYRYLPYVEMLPTALTSGPRDTAISSMITRASCRNHWAEYCNSFCVLVSSRALITPSSMMGIEFSLSFAVSTYTSWMIITGLTYLSFLLLYAVVQIPPVAVLSYRNAMVMDDEDSWSAGYGRDIGRGFLGGTFVERVPMHSSNLWIPCIGASRRTPVATLPVRSSGAPIQ